METKIQNFIYFVALVTRGLVLHAVRSLKDKHLAGAPRMPQPARTPTSCIWPRMGSGCRRRRAGRTFRPNAKQPSIGKLIDEAMPAIEVANPGLKGVLPKD